MGLLPKVVRNIGISSVTGEKHPSPRFYFAMKSDRTSFNSSVFDINKYTPRSWTHITVTYDETAIRMYIGKTLVATSLEQRGEIFGSIARKCKEIRLGGGWMLRMDIGEPLTNYGFTTDL